MELSNFIALQEKRASIYSSWNKALLSFLEDKNSETYQKAISEATQQLKEIRDQVKTRGVSEKADIVAKIEALEDQHLKQNVDYHRERVMGNTSNRLSIAQTEEDIMDLVVELK